MIAIQYPHPSFKIKKEKGKDIIFDSSRKQWVQLTPEEWVRQNFLEYLKQVKKYPASLIAVEREISVNDTKKRFDVVVYKGSLPWMIVECKEMNVKLDEGVIKQILRYNIALQVRYLVVTNGNSTFALELDGGGFKWLEALPDY